MLSLWLLFLLYTILRKVSFENQKQKCQIIYSQVKQPIIIATQTLNILFQIPHIKICHLKPTGQTL